jgi:circadian clock protein KaiB
MARKRPSREAPGPTSATALVMVLYVADGGPNSIRALANLDAICKEHLDGNFRLDVIDVLEFPQRALADGIVVTPSLAKVSPAPAVRSAGNLSDQGSVLHALGITAKNP